MIKVVKIFFKYLIAFTAGLRQTAEEINKEVSDYGV